MREAALDTYFKQHPQLGTPKPGVAESWNDPAYAEAVIYLLLILVNAAETAR